MKRQATPHEGIVIYEQNITRHRDSLHPNEFAMFAIFILNRTYYLRLHRLKVFTTEHRVHRDFKRVFSVYSVSFVVILLKVSYYI